jgi:hypothetical protein
MNFLVLLLLSATPAALLLLALMSRERRRRLPPPQVGLYARFVEDSRTRSREHAEYATRQRDLALWNAQFRPSDDKPVFPRKPCRERPAFREYVHTDPLTEQSVVKCGLMKKVVLPS